jgi:DNA-binding beta-propeller fold protein YncE
VYVADFGNDRVQVFGFDGSLISSFGSRGSGDGQFQRPADVAVGQDGTLFVTDHFNDRVERFSSDGHYQAQLGTLPAASVNQAAVASTGTPTPPGTLTATSVPATPSPSSVATVTATSTSTAGPSPSPTVGATSIATQAVTATPPATPTFAIAPDAQVRRPEGVAVDRDGDLWVADYGRDRVVKLSPDGRLLQSLGSRGSGPGEFVGPKGVAVDPLTGHLYVTDTGNGRIQRLAPDGTAEASWPMPQ